MLQALRKIEERGAIEIAKRVRQRCEAVFKYAIITEKANYNPVSDLQGALSPQNPQNHPALNAKELPDFLIAFTAYPCEKQTKIAFNLLMLTGVRTGELIAAQWCEFDFDAKEWRIPAERMKRRQEHIAPLSHQAITLLEEIRPLTGHFALVFPHRSEPLRPMSNATFLRVIERIGYKERMTGHGLRSVFSSVLNESNLWNTDAIESQLVHVPTNKVKGAYLRTQFLPECHKMMQWYADRMGYRQPDGQGESLVFYCLPEAFKELIKGFDKDFAIKVLREKGWLKVGDGNHNQIQMRLPEGKIRVYALLGQRIFNCD